MKIICGECGIFQEKSYCSLEKRCLAGSCPLFPEIPTILGSDQNPKCKKGRPKGDAGVFSWGYAEIPIGGCVFQGEGSIDEVAKSSSEKEASCLQCLFLKEDGCKIFPKNRDWSYAQKCRSFGRKGDKKGEKDGGNNTGQH